MVNASGLILRILRKLGVDKVFIVSGTDHPAFIMEYINSEDQ